MGRISHKPPADKPVKLRMQKLRMVDGDYDEGGAYWGGIRGTHMYWATNEEVDLYVRAKDRAEAKALLRLDFPLLKFFA